MPRLRRRRTRLCVPLGEGAVEVTTEARTPPGATARLVLAHGAGAGIDHPFMQGLCDALARHGVATTAFAFPYMEAGRRRIDARPVLYAAWAAAIARARRGRLPWFAGGKSMGGRVLAEALADGHCPAHPRGVLFFGYPLHPAGRPDTARARPLARVPVPMWFGQGTRDRLADLDLVRGVVAGLRPRATLYVVEGADHGFRVRKRDGRTFEAVLDAMAGAAAAWIRSHLRGDEP